MRALQSDYLRWAKLCSTARFPLAGSGVASLANAELPIALDALQLNGPGGYGYAPLTAAIAAEYGVPAASVVTAAGASMANYLAFAALLGPGDEVLIERPAYEPLLSLASYLGATVTRFDRREQDGFAVDAERVAAALTPRTRLVVLSNLHNPSGAFTDEATLARVGELAQAVGARVLVDEVYLDAVFAPRQRSAAHLSPTFVTTNSLTKVYGLSGLRCGWVVAEPALAERMWRLIDLHHNNDVLIAQQLSAIAFERLASLRARARTLLEANRALVDPFISAHADRLSFAVNPRHGSILFPRLAGGGVDRLCALLRERYETTVVPGHFFEMPEHFRIGIGCATELVRDGLARLGEALRTL
jgi:aspartate/methionine/tyrosine aminotransferase